MDLDYKKYRWFYTKSGKLVIGGKSATQNDELLKKLNENYLVMHTSDPGSPFAIILSDLNSVTEEDKDECAIFTGSFSRAWREGKKKVKVDIFTRAQLSKSSNMKTGTWGVKPPVAHKVVELKLVLTIQENILRAVPEESVKSKKDILLKIIPGKIDKREMLPKLHIELNDDFKQEEVLSALPPGGLRILKK